MISRALLCTALAALCLAGAPTAAARGLHGLPTYASLYDCIDKAGLTTLKTAIDAAGMNKYFSDPKLKVTLVAPDNLSWEAMFRDCTDKTVKPVNKPVACSLAELLANKDKLVELLKYHQLPGLVRAEKNKGMFKTSNKFTKVKTVEGEIVRMRYWTLGFEIHGTGRDAMIRGMGAQGNIQCGKSLMHVVDNVLTIAPTGTVGAKFANRP